MRLALTLALIVTACGGGDTASQPAPQAPTEPAPAPEPQPPQPEPPTPQPEPPAIPPDTPPPAPAADPPPDDMALSLSIGDGWQAALVDEGIKPDLALDSSSSPALTYLREDFDGWIGFAAAAEGWERETITEGYFYGPIGLAFDGDDRPNVVWHDHQGDTVELEIGDLTHSVREDTGWSVTSVEDPGHDGWDATIAIGDDGVIRAAGIEPSQFGFDTGVEYYELGSGVWYAVRTDGSWQVEQVAAAGDRPFGQLVSLALDASEAPHLAFTELTDPSPLNGLVVYASLAG